MNGALRISEITNLEEDDISFSHNGTAIVRVKSSKTDQAGRGHSFIMTPNPNPKLCAVTRLRNFMNLERSSSAGKCKRLFRSISKNGKKTEIPIGVNKMGAMPKIIATFLELPDVNKFTGHSFRRTSATILSEQGIGLVELKQHGRWRSTTVAERYVNNTITSKTKTSNLLQNLGNNSSTAGNQNHVFNSCTFANCNFNILPN